MSPVSKAGDGRFLTLVLVLALGGLLVVLALQARSNRSTVGDLRSRLDAQSEEMSGLRERMDELAVERKKEKQRGDEAEQHVGELSAEVADLRARIGALGADLERTAAERDEHLGLRLDLARRLGATETALAEGRIARAERERELAGRIDDYEILADSLKEQVAESEQTLKTNRATFAQKLGLFMDELSAATLKLEALTAEYQVAVDARRAAEKSAAALGADLKAALEKAVDLRGEVDRLKTANGELTAARDEMSRRLKDALDQLKEKEAEESPVDPTK